MNGPTVPIEWALASSGGREEVRWVARAVERSGRGTVLVCDVVLEGQYFQPPLDAAPARSRDFVLEMHALAAAVPTLERLGRHLETWLSLPPSEMVRTPLALDCELGSLFDQEIRLILGDRADIISSGNPVATVRYRIGRLSGEMSFVTNAVCLRALCEGLTAALTWATE